MSDDPRADATGEPRMDVTGERLVPGSQHGELVHAEHLVRYHLAAQLARSRNVLDIACGEGYGTAMLAAAGATEAVGVDIDPAAVAHAETRYANATFAVGDVTDLSFANDSFDLVVSFETIEHVKEPERALDELRRVLRDDGVLLISTPNKHQYLVDNEFHEREYTHEEFLGVLSARFPRVELLLQHNWNASLILPADVAADSGGEQAHRVELRKTVGIYPGQELYTLALCTVSGELPALGPSGIAVSPDEAHQLATRLRSAEETAAKWHSEWQKAKAIADHWIHEYWVTRNSIWWRITGPLRKIARLMGKRGG